MKKLLIVCVLILLIVPTLVFSASRMSITDRNELYLLLINPDGSVNVVANSTFTVIASSPTFGVTAYQGGAWIVQFSTTTGKAEVFQAAHDNLNANVNMQQGNADVGSTNRIYVQFSSSTSGVVVFQYEKDRTITAIVASSSTNKTAAYIQGTVPVSGTFWQTTQPVSFSTPAAKTEAYQGGSWTVDNSSQTPVNSAMMVWNGVKWVEALSEGTTNYNIRVALFYNNNQVQVGQMASDGVSSTLYSLFTKGHLYGFNGTTWDRLRSDKHKHFYVRTSTNSHTQIDNTVATADERYAAHIATGTSGRITTDGTIPNTAFDITNPSFMVLNGTATVTGLLGGKIFLEEGAVWNPGQLPKSVDSPTIVVDLDEGIDTYFEYSLIGKQ